MQRFVGDSGTDGCVEGLQLGSGGGADFDRGGRLAHFHGQVQAESGANIHFLGDRLGSLEACLGNGEIVGARRNIDNGKASGFVRLNRTGAARAAFDQLDFGRRNDGALFVGDDTGYGSGCGLSPEAGGSDGKTQNQSSERQQVLARESFRKRHLVKPLPKLALRRSWPGGTIKVFEQK